MSIYLKGNYPKFWLRQGTLLSVLLRPISWLYQSAGWLRWMLIKSNAVSIPVICVGNLSVGGVGKTPVVSALAQALRNRGTQVHVLSHGYGGQIKTPHCVDPEKDSAIQVGDEALLLAPICPTWIGKDRFAVARAAQNAGAKFIILDDGWQDPRLHKDYVLAVVRADNPFGNRALLPAGPLRQLPKTLSKANHVIAIGDSLTTELQSFQPLRASRRLKISGKPFVQGTKIFGFCGIGLSAQFHDALLRYCTEHGYKVDGFQAFADHHLWTERQLKEIEAVAKGAVLVCTQKDHVRLSPSWKVRVRFCTLSLVWQDKTAFSQLVETFSRMG